MDIEKLNYIIAESYSYAECLRALEWSDNGYKRKQLKTLIENNDISIQHFNSQLHHSKRIKYEQVDKSCPVCAKIFTTQKGHPREKVTCSRSCSNTYFNGVTRNINITNHRTICFRHHVKKCVICGEKNIVEAHHLDHDNKNNSPENLIPMCPTHHQYWHSRYRKLVEPTIREYIKKWKEDKKS